MRSARSGIIVGACTALFLASGCTVPETEPDPLNHAPVIIEAKIAPAEATVVDTLSLRMKARDEDRDHIDYAVVWFLNKAPLTNEYATTLDASDLRHGDIVHAQVTPYDGTTYGDPVLTDPVEIRNSPPRILAVWLEPASPRAGEGPAARVQANDPDGDPLHFSYEWLRNNIRLTVADDMKLPEGSASKGDRISCRVTAFDGFDWGRPAVSNAVVVANSIPVFTSNPPEQTTGNSYQYQVSAFDPDGDPLHFQLGEGHPKGMYLDDETGLIEWEIPEGTKEAYEVSIELNDGESPVVVQSYKLVIGPAKQQES